MPNHDNAKGTAASRINALYKKEPPCLVLELEQIDFEPVRFDVPKFEPVQFKPEPLPLDDWTADIIRVVFVEPKKEPCKP